MMAEREALIAVLPGDGVGPEVVAEGIRVLEGVAERWGHQFEIREGLVGGRAIDEVGDPLPAETLELCREADAILLGAVGGPKWDDPEAPRRAEMGVLRLQRTRALRKLATGPADTWSRVRLADQTRTARRGRPRRRQRVDRRSLLRGEGTRTTRGWGGARLRYLRLHDGRDRASHPDRWGAGP